jgi:hypothetical protein
MVTKRNFISVFAFTLWSRIATNIYLSIESIILLVILFKNFNSDYVAMNCGCPWIALFVILLLNVIVISNWQDLSTIIHLLDSLYYFPKIKYIEFELSFYRQYLSKQLKNNYDDYIQIENDRINKYINKKFKSTQCCIYAQTFIVLSLNLIFRLCTFHNI